MPFQNIADQALQAFQRNQKKDPNSYGGKTGSSVMSDLLKQENQTLGSYQFGGNNPGSIINEPGSSTNGPIVCGYKPEVSGDVNPNYVIRIQSKRFQISAVMQDKLQMKVESRWEPLVDVDSSSTFKILETLAQGALKSSLQTTYTSRRIWSGTSALEIMLTLKFEAVYDAITEVLLPIQGLQEIASPSIGDPIGFMGVKFPLLNPPGPSPLNPEGTPVETSADNPIVKHLAAGDCINISVGNFMVFKNVVVHTAVAEWDPRFTSEGIPVGGKVDMVFQTYEVITKNQIQEIYKNRASR